MNTAPTNRNLIFLPDPMVADDSFTAESDALLRHAVVSREACAELTLGIVHEMNNLSGGIGVLGEVYLQGADSGLPMSEGLELIQQSAGRLQKLVRHLKIVHGPIRQEPTYFDVGKFVRSLLELFSPVLPKDTFIETDFDPEELDAHVDEVSLRLALLGLVLNLRDVLAIQRLPEHGLRASLRRMAGDRAELVLAPTDRAGVDIRARFIDAAADARERDAEHTLEELGGRLTRGSHGEYIVELPLVS